MTVSVLWKTDINLIDPPPTHTHLLTFHEETVQFRDSTETQTLLHFLTHRGMTACMYVLAWLSIIVTYLIKIGKTVGILTQTLVLSPESVTSSYFPKLLQIHDIQCTEQRRDTCYRQTPDLCQPQTKLGEVMSQTLPNVIERVKGWWLQRDCILRRGSPPAGQALLQQLTAVSFLFVVLHENSFLRQDF